MSVFYMYMCVYMYVHACECPYVYMLAREYTWGELKTEEGRRKKTIPSP